MNAYLYNSSFSSDKTAVDLSKAENIKIGMSKDDVLAIMGKPHAKALCPTQMYDLKDNCAKAKEVRGWMAYELRHANKVVENKKLFVMIDENNKVIEFKASDVNN